MNDGPRPYRSSLREDQARATRRRIVEVGHDLFAEQGYAATTVDAIAARAGVSRRTVFTSVGGKAAVLKLAWDWTLAGDDKPAPIADRPAVHAMQAETDPVRLVSAWARFQAEIALRLVRLYDVLVIAADSDAEAAAQLEVAERNRLGGSRAFVEHLAGIGGLRPGLDVDRGDLGAAVLMDPMPARRLVHDGGWSVAEYVAYVERVAAAALLP